MKDSAIQLEQQAGQLRNQGKGYEAAKVYQQAKEAYLKLGNLQRAAGCQHMIGVAYKIENDLDKALAAYQNAIVEYEAAGDPLGPGRVQRDIGIMYEYHDQLDKAQEHLQLSREQLQTLPEDLANDRATRNAELGITLAKIGLVGIREHRFEHAEDNLMEGLSLIRRAGDTFYELTALMHLASLYFATKHYGRMLANAEAALGLLYDAELQNEHGRRLAQIHGLMAHGYLHHGNHETAQRYAKKALDFIESLSQGAQEPLLKDIEAHTLRDQLHIP